MAEFATVNIKNNAGRSLDSVVLWHTSTPPNPGELGTPLITAQNVGDQIQLTAQCPLTSGSPMDCWTGGVRFHGDGTNYIITGVTGEAYKEYEVSSGSTITFTIQPYTTNTTNQPDIPITYEDDGGTAGLLNPWTQVADSAFSELAEEIILHLV